MKRIALFFPLILALTACGTTTAANDPAYIAPTQYDDYSCKQIRAEMRLVSSKIDQMNTTDGTTQVLNTALSAFAISQGYGVNQVDDTASRRLQNEYDVLQETSIKKNCNL